MLIPEKYVIQIKNSTFNPSKFKAEILQMKFMKAIDTYTKEFLNINFDFESDEELLNNDALQITKTDKIAKSYKINVLNTSEIENLLKNVSFINYLNQYTILKDYYNFAVYNLSRKNHIKLDNILSIYEKLLKKYRLICNGKNLNFYKEKYTAAVSELNIVKLYTNRLGLTT